MSEEEKTEQQEENLSEIPAQDNAGEEITEKTNETTPIQPDAPNEELEGISPEPETFAKTDVIPEPETIKTDSPPTKPVILSGPMRSKVDVPVSTLKVGDIVISDNSYPKRWDGLGKTVIDPGCPSNIEMKIKKITGSYALCAWKLNGVEQEREFNLAAIHVK